MMMLDRERLMKMMNVEMRRSMSERVLVYGGFFLGGALLGTAFGLLTARKPGVELRRDLRAKADQATHGVLKEGGLLRDRESEFSEVRS
ncbi:MAG: YtxH domain-containing protein [Myxococcaceae bacterium]|nr:YtxH domain-containing protein [Myxococcaceae bacterium]